MDGRADQSWDFVVSMEDRGLGCRWQSGDAKAGASQEDWSDMTRNVIIIRIKPPTGSMEWKSVSASIRWHWRDLAESFVLLWMKLFWLVVIGMGCRFGWFGWVVRFGVVWIGELGICWFDWSARLSQDLKKFGTQLADTRLDYTRFALHNTKHSI